MAISITSTQPKNSNFEKKIEGLIWNKFSFRHKMLFKEGFLSIAYVNTHAKWQIRMFIKSSIQSALNDQAEPKYV